jgi:penicillin-binding protein 1A
MNFKKILAVLIGLFFLSIAAVTAIVVSLNSELPQLITVADYKPLLVSHVYDRNKEKIGEFTREKRQLVAYDKTPKVVIDAFLAAEDATFFRHSGINYFAIARAFLANLRAGEKVQGASTITQQVARSLLLSNEKTYTRKIKEILLAYKMESNLSKQDILFLYLNQIFLGQKAYGVAIASQVYFNKPLEQITLPEAAMLAGLPKAPSAYSPLRNPKRAKERQVYVLARMAEEGMISRDEYRKAASEPLKVFEHKDYWGFAPFYLETIRQMLIERLTKEVVEDNGVEIHTSLDLKKQAVAAEQIKLGLRELDKRQGFRGPLKKIEATEEVAAFLLATRNKLLDAQAPFKTLLPNGTITQWGPLNLSGLEPVPANAPRGTKPAPTPVLPSYIPNGTLTQGIVTRVDDNLGLAYVRFAETKGLIDLETVQWGRPPDPNADSRYLKEITKMSEVLNKGDVIEIRVLSNTFVSTRLDKKIAEMKEAQQKKAVKGKKAVPFELPNDYPNFKEFANLQLEQEPLTQGSLIAIDQQTQEIISLVGGYEFNANNQLNRAIQTVRQTGSSFKPFVYLSALDKGYNPASMILDAPIVYEEEQEVEGSDNKESVTKRWKPTNMSNKFMGDIMFRNALIQSLNVPSVKIIEKTGVSWAADYARRLGIFSPLNLDFTLALGSSSVTLYEMTKSFAQIGKLGRKIRPVIVHKVLDKDGKVLLENLTLDDRFVNETKVFDEEFEMRRENYLAWEAAQPKVEEGQPPAEPVTVTLPHPTTPNGAPARNPSKEPPIFFKDPDQLVKPQTAFVLTSLLQGVVEEVGGTGQRAKALGRPTAGKTGTTQSYYDAWFIGYTPDIAAGVWVGYDQEKSLGRGEGGGRTALPIWVEYMKAAHEGLPVRSFPTPDGIVFSSLDNETGRLASSNSKEVVRQAFVIGTEPKEIQDDSSSSPSTETQDFYKQDLSD